MSVVLHMLENLDDQIRSTMKRLCELPTNKYLAGSDATSEQCHNDHFSPLWLKKHLEEYKRDLITTLGFPRLPVSMRNCVDYNLVFFRFFIDLLNNSKKNQPNINQVQIARINKVFNILLDSNISIISKEILLALSANIKIIDKNAVYPGKYRRQVLSEDILSKYYQFPDIPTKIMKRNSIEYFQSLKNFTYVELVKLLDEINILDFIKDLRTFERKCLVATSQREYNFTFIPNDVTSNTTIFERIMQLVKYYSLSTLLCENNKKAFERDMELCSCVNTPYNSEYYPIKIKENDKKGICVYDNIDWESEMSNECIGELVTDKIFGSNHNEVNIYKKVEKVILYSMLKAKHIILTNSNLSVGLIQEMMSCMSIVSLAVYEFPLYLPLNMNRAIESKFQKCECECECTEHHTIANLPDFESNSISKLFKEMLEEINYWLELSTVVAVTSSYINNCKNAILIESLFLSILQNLFKIGICENKYFYVIGTEVMKLIKNFIIFQSKIVKEKSNEIFNLTCEILNHDGVKMALSKYYTSNDESLFNEVEKDNVKDNLLYIHFDNTEEERRRIMNIRCSIIICNELISIDFIKGLEDMKDTLSFDLFAEMLILLIQEFHLATINHANDMFLKIFAYPWRPKTYSEISKLLRRVASEGRDKLNKSFYGGFDVDTDDDSSDLEKSILFMDLLSDFSRDIDM